MPMSLFVSRRERRLWIWTLTFVVTIYATMGLTARLAEALSSDDQRAVFFLLAMFLVAAAVVSEGLTLRPRGVEIGVALGVVAVYLMFFLRLTLAERTHLIEYGVVAIFIHQALSERATQGRHVPRPALLAVLGAATVGIVDEGIQFFVPSRVFDPVDILFNVMAATMAVGACVALRWSRGKVGRRITWPKRK